MMCDTSEEISEIVRDSVREGDEGVKSDRTNECHGECN